MGDTLNYNRPKASAVNDTAIDITIKSGESDESPLPDTAGTTGITKTEYYADADESGSSDIQLLATFLITPAIDVNTGRITFTVAFTPKGGGGGAGTTTSQVFTHHETMDAWQAAAGRARQS